jgi:hypothetical protein
VGINLPHVGELAYPFPRPAYTGTASFGSKPAQGRTNSVAPFRASLLTIIAAALAWPAAAGAQGKLEAHYTASLASIPIGKGTFTVEISEHQYTAQATGSTTGLLKIFTGGQGTSTGRGTLSGGKLMSSIYASTISTTKKIDDTRLTVAGGNVKDSKVDPPIDTDPERIKITEEHQHNITDPISASLVRVSDGDMLAPGACQRTLAIFDGRLRYDLQLAFKRMETVKADKGYAGKAVVCSVTFAPVAGFIPSRAAIKYLVKQRDMEVWLAPIAGTRVLVPFRVQGPTPIGEARLEADQFVAVAYPTRASAGAPKAQ